MTQSDNAITRRLGRRGRIALGAAALLAVGGGAGALAVVATAPTVTMAPAAPVPIRSLGADGIVTVRGRIAEVYGNRFVMADASGRMLVDAGHDAGTKYAVGQAITVQGRFDDGSIHAAFLVDGAGHVREVGPLGRPHHGPRGGPDGPGGPRGAKDDRGPDRAAPDMADRGPPPAVPTQAPAAAQAPAAQR